MNATRALETLAGDRATLVFFDPPYADVARGAVAKLFEIIASRDVVAGGATLVLEHASRDTKIATAPAHPRISLLESRAYGDTTLSLFAYAVVYTPPTP